MNIHWNFEPSLWSWPWKQHSKPYTKHSSLWWYIIQLSSSVDMVETVILNYISPNCDPELKDSKPIFLHDTLAHDDASPYQVWLQKVQQLRRYCPDEHSPNFWTFSVTLTLTTTEQSNLFTRQSDLRWCGTKTKFSYKRISSSEVILGSPYFLLYDPSMWP